MKGNDSSEENERHFRLLFQEAPVPYSSIDEKGDIVAVNKKWLANMGFSQEEVLGKSFTDFVNTSTKKHFINNFELLKRKCAIDTLILEMRRKDGSLFWASCDVQTLFNTQGELRHIYCVCQDITHQKEIDEMVISSHSFLERQIEKRTRELRKQAKEKQKNLLALQKKSQELEEANIALKVLLQQSSKAQDHMEEKVEANIKELVFPYLDQMAIELIGRKGAVYVDIIRKKLENVTSSFSHKLTSELIGLTPREIQIAELVKQGRGNKEIGELLQLSTGTVDVYRNNIRKKLGLRNKKINLRVYLQTNF